MSDPGKDNFHKKTDKWQLQSTLLVSLLVPGVEYYGLFSHYRKSKAAALVQTLAGIFFITYSKPFHQHFWLFHTFYLYSNV